MWQVKSTWIHYFKKINNYNLIQSMKGIQRHSSQSQRDGFECLSMNCWHWPQQLGIKMFHKVCPYVTPQFPVPIIKVYLPLLSHPDGGNSIRNASSHLVDLPPVRPQLLPSKTPSTSSATPVLNNPSPHGEKQQGKTQPRGPTSATEKPHNPSSGNFHLTTLFYLPLLLQSLKSC